MCVAKARRKTAGVRAAGGTIPSIRALARAIGVGPTTVTEYLRDARWPFARRGPWRAGQVPAMRAWRRDTLADNPAERAGKLAEGIGGGGLAQAKTVAQIKVLVEREANLKVNRLIKEREYVQRQEAEEASAKKWLAVRKALGQVPRALRQLLADTTDPVDVERILTEALRAVCNHGFGDEGRAG